MMTIYDPGLKLNFRVPGSKTREPIRYSIGKNAGDMLLIGRSSAGVCAIFWDEDPALLQEQLSKAFPDVQCIRDDAGLTQDLEQVVNLLEQRPLSQPLELDVGGTAFQQKVWQALCAIPTGETRSYREIAALLGRPEASRAVAGACAANLLAIAIPCHRVVRSDGALSGYRWGVARKRALLDQEERIAGLADNQASILSA